MIYGEPDIANALESGEFRIEPRPSRDLFSTSSVDLRLGSRFNVFEAPLAGTEISVLVHMVDVEAVAMRYAPEVSIPDGGYIEVKPNAFVLGYTLESVALPRHLAARVEGKSSLARLGLSIHQTAPTVQAGWNGHLRLEISNVGPFVCRLIPGIPICQLIFEELKRPATNPLTSRFQEPGNYR